MAEEPTRLIGRGKWWLTDRRPLKRRAPAIRARTAACVSVILLVACGGRENVCPPSIAFVEPQDEVSIEWGPSDRYSVATTIDSGSAACIAEFSPAVRTKDESIDASTGYHVAVTIHIHALKGDSAGYASLFLSGGPTASLRIEALDRKGTIIDTGRAAFHLGRGVNRTSVAGRIDGLGPDAVRQIRSVRARWIFE